MDAIVIQNVRLMAIAALVRKDIKVFVKKLRKPQELDATILKIIMEQMAIATMIHQNANQNMLNKALCRNARNVQLSIVIQSLSSGSKNIVPAAKAIAAQPVQNLQQGAIAILIVQAMAMAVSTIKVFV